MKTHFYFQIVMLLFFSEPLLAQNTKEILLWSDNVPGGKTVGGVEKVRVYEPTGDHVVSNIHFPSITTYLPNQEKSTGIAIIIAPGGGHRELWIDHEGHNVAKNLQARGIAAFVLKYRLAKEENSSYTVEDHSVRDMQRAIRLVRSKAKEWNLNLNKIGVMGFSAGGEVAALADMYSNSNVKYFNDAVDKWSSKSNFQALIYPGRSHKIIPTSESSPAFIVCGYKDRDDIAKGMANLYLKFKDLNIPADLHIYSNEGHGFGIRKSNEGAGSKWIDQLYDWLQELK